MASCIEKLVSIVSGDLKTDKLNPSVFKWKIGDTKEHFNNRNSFSIFSRCYFCYSFYTTIQGSSRLNQTQNEEICLLFIREDFPEVFICTLKVL